MATAVWELLDRPSGTRPATLPLWPDGSPRRRRVPAYVRRRLTLLVLAVGLLGTLPSALDLVGLAGPSDDAPEETPPPIQAVVRPGDTIWDLAAPHVPEGMSLSDYVAEVLLLNDVDPGALQPGSVLDLPQLE